MDKNNTSDINPKETNHYSDDLLKEILDLQKSELAHLEDEFQNYKHLYPNDELKWGKSGIH